MTDVKIDRVLGAKILTATSLVALVAGLVVLWLPHPALGAPRPQSEKQVQDLMNKSDAEKAEFATLDKANRTRTWSCSQEEVGPSALATMTRLAKVCRLKLTAFRPQKAVELKGVTEMPFLMEVEGTFLNIESLLKELEKPELKLVPDMFQLAAGDESVENVTATITVAAFWQAPPAEKKSEGAKSAPGTTSSVRSGAGAATASKSGPSIEVKISPGTAGKTAPSGDADKRGGTHGRTF